MPSGHQRNLLHPREGFTTELGCTQRHHNTLMLGERSETSAVEEKKPGFQTWSFQKRRNRHREGNLGTKPAAGMQHLTAFPTKKKMESLCCC